MRVALSSAALFFNSVLVDEGRRSEAPPFFVHRLRTSVRKYTSTPIGGNFRAEGTNNSLEGNGSTLFALAGEKGEQESGAEKSRKSVTVDFRKSKMSPILPIDERR
jgi:hypothetical protein